jgi:hypothetical protein
LVVYNKYERVADYPQKTNAYGIGFFIRNINNWEMDFICLGKPGQV